MIRAAWRQRRGFTLVEVLVALSLGATMCLTAFAAVRLAASALSTADRLSTENGLMREGVRCGLDELDFWRVYDDPTDATRQPLRQRGMPFWPVDAWPTPYTSDDFNLDFDQSDTHAWFLGEMTRVDPAKQLGDYSLVQRIDHDEPARRWQPLFVRRFADYLGYYGMLEYAPANMWFAYYEGDGSTPAEFKYWFDGRGLRSGSEDHELYLGWKDPNRPYGWEGIVHTVSFHLTTACAIANPPLATTDPLFDVDHRCYVAGSGGIDNRFLVASPTMPLAPSTWPRLTVSCEHFVHEAACFTNRAWVRVASPVTGKTMMLTISPTSTTLRGARRQRSPGTGWAAAGARTLDGDQ